MRPLRLRYAPTAQRDLANIFRHISKDRPAAGAAVVARVRACAEGLREFPMMGHIGHVQHTRERVTPGLPYVIVYRVEGDGRQITVLGIYHGAQNRP